MKCLTDSDRQIRNMFGMREENPNKNVLFRIPPPNHAQQQPFHFPNKNHPEWEIIISSSLPIEA